MKLDDQTAVLAATGPTVNCHGCLRRLGDQATALALSPQEMTAAEEVGPRINRATGDKTATSAPDVAGTAGANRPGDRQPAADGAPAGRLGRPRLLQRIR